jgi:hypothetical protein
MSACANIPESSQSSDQDAPSSSQYLNHSEAQDFDETFDEKGDGLTSRFDPNWLMSDSFFLDAYALDQRGLQALFEESPYGKRSWLASAYIDSVPASQRLIEVAKEVGINPLLLLSRMQVEQSLISRTEPPSHHQIDFAFGCGCPDYRGCQEAYRGLSKQIKCAGKTLLNLYNQSLQQTGTWKAGKSRETLDPEWVQPANHATAALYAYTPWVLRKRGGNWLVWNVTQKMVRFLKEKAYLNRSSDRQCLNQSGRAFVGDLCSCDQDCAFWNQGQHGFCHEAGFCSLPCTGTCPDVLGKASTFCIENEGERVNGEGGICVSKAEESNGHCADLPDTLDRMKNRFVGESTSVSKEALVCAP